jgi:tetratricopeptide (TPR) repeat protein
MRILPADVLPELLPPRGYVAPDELHTRGGRSGAAWEARLAAVRADHRAATRDLIARGVTEALAGRHGAALAALDEAARSLEPADTPGRLLLMLNRAQALLETGDLAAADELAADALRLALREREDRWIALATLSAALVHLARGRRGEARNRLGDAVRQLARDGDTLRQVQCHYLLGEIAYLAEDPIRAGSHYRDALGVARAAHEQEWIDLLTLRFEHR